ncbi:probable G-protein coupled receptor 139 [Hypanus sabinus]|uniref:probable G-protein coupled receptor 139 n=1 Tax=Hypanus sabinus TaxID=79690 RepID=UPI0028C3A413|nr:probable G-protein coupled receptor 139 [Hypanus sabinus]
MGYPLIFRIDRIYYPVLAAVGVPVNLVAIVILSRGRCGLSKCITRYLMAMSTADLLVVIVEVIIRRVNSIDCSVWLTVTFTFDRFVAICCRKLKAHFCTGKMAALVLSSTFIVVCLKNIPFYFIPKPSKVVNGVLWFCKLNPSYYTEPGWVAFDRDCSVWLTVTFTFDRFVAICCRKLKAHFCTGKMAALFLSSTCIVVCLKNIPFYFISKPNANNYTDSEFIISAIGYMLQNLSCCTNTFIYGVTQSRFREQFINALKFPVTSVKRFINEQRN